MKQFIFNKTAFLLFAIPMMAACVCSCHSNTGVATFNDPIDLSARNTMVSPAQDFFEYANGTWLKNTEIPADKARVGSFATLADSVLVQIKGILDSCIVLKNPKAGTPAQLTGNLYASVLDTAAIENAGLSPLRADLARIAAIKEPGDIIHEIGLENTNGDWFWNWYQWGWDDIITGTGQLCTLYVFADNKNSNITRLHCDQGGLGLPNKTYYFKTDSAGRHIIEVYKNYITSILSLLGGSSEPKADAEAIFALEKKLAEASSSREDLYVPEKNYHLMSVDEMQSLTPNVQWRQLLNIMDIRTDTLLVGQPAFYKTLSDLLKSIPIFVWEKYLSFHLVNQYAPWLSTPYANAAFTLQRVITGQKERAARWKAASMLVNSTIGEALGELYVNRYFPPTYKKYMKNMVNNLKAAFREHIENIDWMSNSTKTLALDKLNAMVAKIGYPEKWKDFSSVNISKDSLIDNLKRIGQWYYHYNIDKLHKPTDRSEWLMTSATVNAYNNPTSNDINFPAAILQPPFYFPNGDDAVNYGSIGAVIGHEMSHSFDNMGSKYDKEGSLKNWWTKADQEEFDKRADMIVKQFDQYTVLDSVHLNGKLEEVENIADLGGIAIAYTAFQKTIEAKRDTLVSGLTPNQRFFMANAQIWRSKLRPQTLAWLVSSNGHAPAKYRANGPVSNIPEFYKAFNVKPGDKMYRADSVRVKIW